MQGRDTLRSRDLKKQLQTASAARRADNQSETRIAALVSERGRNDLQPELATVFRATKDLRPAPNRTRETTPQLLEATIGSIQRFGMVLPILIDKHDTIVVGHTLWKAAIRLGLETVKCKVIEHLDPLELEALSLAVNRIGEIGKYNLDKLRDRMIAIESGGIELLTTGFNVPELDLIKFKPLEAETTASDELEEDVATLDVTSRLGDLFELGRHRLICADALDEGAYQRLLGDTRAHVVFSDPPYNCKIEGFVGGKGQHQHEDFLMFAGKESDGEFRQFLTSYLQVCRSWCTPGAVIFACMDWRQIDRLLQAGEAAGLARINIAIWNKGSGGMGGLYRSAHEFVAVFCTAPSPAINNVALGAHGRDRTNVWTYPSANRRGSSAALALADHPTPKPIELVVDAVIDVSCPNDLVLDPFSGSGTTLIAADQCGRNARCIELDPKYIDRSIRRWERLTGQQALHVESGLTFSELGQRRRFELEDGADV